MPVGETASSELMGELSRRPGEVDPPPPVPAPSLLLVLEEVDTRGDSPRLLLSPSEMDDPVVPVSQEVLRLVPGVLILEVEGEALEKSDGGDMDRSLASVCPGEVPALVEPVDAEGKRLRSAVRKTSWATGEVGICELLFVE